MVKSLEWIGKYTGNLKELEKVVSKIPTAERRIDEITIETLRTIEDLMKGFKTPSISFSTGVDSLVMLHLSLKIKPDILVFYGDCGASFPSDYKLLNLLRKKWNINLHIVKHPSIFEIYKKHGFATTAEKEGVDIAKEIMLQNKKRYNKKFGVDATFLGLLREESFWRKRLKKYKYFDEKMGVFNCYPLLDWTKVDIWLYVFLNKIPYNEEYDNQEGIPLSNRRLGVWAGDSCVEYGRLVWLKKNHPELFNKLSEAVPEARQFI